MENVGNQTMYSYKIPISKSALREKYDPFLLKSHIVFQLHGQRYQEYDRINYTIKLSLREMVLTMTKKDGHPFFASEWIFFDQILPEFFEKLEIEFIQEKEMMEEYGQQ